jgi:hypothetical protein
MIYNAPTVEDPTEERVEVVRTKLELMRDRLVEHLILRATKMVAPVECKRFEYSSKYAHGVKDVIKKRETYSERHALKHREEKPILIGTCQREIKGLVTYSGKSFTTDVEWPDPRSQVIRKIQ